MQIFRTRVALIKRNAVAYQRSLTPTLNLTTEAFSEKVIQVMWEQKYSVNTS